MFPPLSLNLISSRWINACIALYAVATGFTLTSSSFAAPGDLYVTDLATGSIIVYAPDGTPTTFDTGLTSPQGIAFDQAKNLYVVDAGNGTSGAGTIFKYDINIGGSSKTTFRTGLSNPQGMAIDGSGLLVSEKTLNRVIRVPLDGGTPTVFQLITGPLGLDSRGINDGAGRYRWVAAGPSVLKKAPDGTITYFDFSATPSRAVTLDLTGNAYVSTGIGSITEILASDGTMKTFTTGFTLPTGMDFRPAKFGGNFDRVGFLFVADTAAGTISQVSQQGAIATFVSGAGMPNYMVFEPAGPPVVVTGIASNITGTTATLNGTVNPEGNPTTYHFQYGLTTAYGSNTTTTSVGSGQTTLPVSADLTGLLPSTTYHFRVTATNGNGTVNGADATFTTSTTFTVTVGDGGFFFVPTTVALHVGDTVKWTWSSSGHSSTSGACAGSSCAPDGLWDSGILSQGSTFSHTFLSAGSFPYFCSAHGGCCGMRGTVTVSSPTP